VVAEPRHSRQHPAIKLAAFFCRAPFPCPRNRRASFRRHGTSFWYVPSRFVSLSLLVSESVLLICTYRRHIFHDEKYARLVQLQLWEVCDNDNSSRPVEVSSRSVDERFRLRGRRDIPFSMKQNKLEMVHNELVRYQQPFFGKRAGSGRLLETDAACKLLQQQRAVWIMTGKTSKLWARYCVGARLRMRGCAYTDSFESS
jgi:hypothetical protein